MVMDVNLYRPNSHECESNLLKYNFPDLGLQWAIYETTDCDDSPYAADCDQC